MELNGLRYVNNDTTIPNNHDNFEDKMSYYMFSKNKEVVIYTENKIRSAYENIILPNWFFNQSHMLRAPFIKFCNNYDINSDTIIPVSQFLLSQEFIDDQTYTLV